MKDLFCQLLDCDSLKEGQGKAYWNAMKALDTPKRPWQSDTYDVSESDLREACERGLRLLLKLPSDDWIVSVDWETGTLNLSGQLSLPDDLPPLLKIIDSLCESLQPRFSWGDVDGPNPKGLLNSIREGRIEWLFWINIYGPAIVKKLGLEFFLGAPFKKVYERAGGGGVCCVTASRPGSISASRLSDLTTYFANHSLIVKTYSTLNHSDSYSP